MRLGSDRGVGNRFLALRVGCGAIWEIRTSNAIDAARTQRRFDSIRRADAAALEARRQRLAAMLAEEHALFERQMDELEERPEARKARMQARDLRGNAFGAIIANESFRFCEHFTYVSFLLLR